MRFLPLVNSLNPLPEKICRICIISILKIFCKCGMHPIDRYFGESATLSDYIKYTKSLPNGSRHSADYHFWVILYRGYAAPTEKYRPGKPYPPQISFLNHVEYKGIPRRSEIRLFSSVFASAIPALIQNSSILIRNRDKYNGQILM